MFFLLVVNKKLSYSLRNHLTLNVCIYNCARVPAYSFEYNKSKIDINASQTKETRFVLTEKTIAILPSLTVFFIYLYETCINVYLLLLELLLCSNEQLLFNISRNLYILLITTLFLKRY